jgi:hypothetical protein
MEVKGSKMYFTAIFILCQDKMGDGQNIEWHTHSEWTKDFNGMLEKLRD